MEWAAERCEGCLKVIDLALVGRKGYNMSAWTSGLCTLEGDREEDIMLLS